MPTYTYKREDGSVFEYEQKITAAPLETCPTTGQKVKRIISGGAGLVFKGSGFYLTDYANKNGGSSSTSSSDGGNDKKKTDSSTSEASTAKAESTTSSASESSSTNTSSSD